MSRRYLDAFSPTPPTDIPIWMMRQAGRYLPEYRAIRNEHSFLDMVYNPDIAAEITMQPIRRFGFDAAILFSDILVTPQALGMDLSFNEGVGPRFKSPIRSKDCLKRLSHSSNVLAPIYDTIRQLRSMLPEQTALIGFAGAPFTVASYMIEGGTSKDLKTTKKMMVGAPNTFQEIINTLTKITVDYLEQQVIAGAEALQIFDNWMTHLDWAACEQYSATPLKQMVDDLRQRGVTVPITFFGKQTSVFTPLLVDSGIQAISMDWNANMAHMDANLPTNIGLQGNLDPFLLHGPKPLIQSRVQAICSAIQSGRPFIFNLGHGLMPDIPISAVEWVIEAVRNHTRALPVAPAGDVYQN